MKKRFPLLSRRSCLVDVVDVLPLSAQFCFRCYMFLPAGVDAKARSIFEKVATN